MNATGCNGNGGMKFGLTRLIIKYQSVVTLIRLCKAGEFI